MTTKAAAITAESLQVFLAGRTQGREERLSEDTEGQCPATYTLTPQQRDAAYKADPIAYMDGYTRGRSELS